MPRAFARRPWLATLVLAGAGGLLLSLAHSPLGFWPALWLAPAIVVCLGFGATRLQTIVAAVVMGSLGSMGALGAAWEPLLGVALVVYRTLVLLVALTLIRVERGSLPPLVLTLVPPSVAVAAEFAMSASPLGTALSDGYLMADATLLVQLAAVTGVYGITFLTAWAGSVLGLVIWRPGGNGWHGPVIVAVVVLALVAAGGWRHVRAMPREALTVGAVHAPTEQRGAPETWEDNARRLAAFSPLVLEAAARGASVVVWPEMILSRHADWNARLSADLADLARASGAWQVVGFFERDARRNVAQVIDPAGRVRAEYQKTHLVVARESSHPGTDPPPVVDLGGVRLGVMICNDDVFTGVARRLGRDGAQLVADPTWDWPDVAAAHARIPRLRAAENRVAIIRATQGGISQLIDPRGRVLASHDVLAAPRQVLVGEVPLGEGGSFYARAGDVFAWVAVVLLAGLVVGALRRRAARDYPVETGA